MEAPKVIWAGKVDGFGTWHEAKDWVDNTRYIRSNAPELVALVEAMRGIADAGQYASGRDMGEIAQGALAAWDALTNE